MLKIIVWTFLAVLLYRLVFRFIIPILRVTKAASDRVREMQQQMDGMQQNNTGKQQPAKPAQMKEGDYIEYEEVK